MTLVRFLCVTLAMLLSGSQAWAETRLKAGRGGDEYVHRISLQQGTTLQYLSPGQQKVRIQKAPFALRFTLNFDPQSLASSNALQVAVLHDKPTLESVRRPRSCSQFPWFMPGTGLAVSGIYHQLWVDQSAHHYVVYHMNEPRAQRALFRGVHGHRIALEWPIQGVAPPFGSIPGFWMVIFRDDNENQMVEEHEYFVLEVVYT